MISIVWNSNLFESKDTGWFSSATYGNSGRGDWFGNDAESLMGSPGDEYLSWIFVKLLGDVLDFRSIDDLWLAGDIIAQGWVGGDDDPFLLAYKVVVSSIKANNVVVVQWRWINKEENLGYLLNLKSSGWIKLGWHSIWFMAGTTPVASIIFSKFFLEKFETPIALTFLVSL